MVHVIHHDAVHELILEVQVQEVHEELMIHDAQSFLD